MKKNNSYNMITTNDLVIRSALKKVLKRRYASDKKLRVIEELGIQHGSARVDIAVVNGTLNGYEIKSDQDTLRRLPEQMDAFNHVFDKMIIVVGKKHLYEAMNIVPDWWGIIVAKIEMNGSVVFNNIREGELNQEQDSISMAKLLWREEALNILKKEGQAKGFLSKPRDSIYKKLVSLLDQKALGTKIREAIFLRGDWRSGLLSPLNDGL